MTAPPGRRVDEPGRLTSVWRTGLDAAADPLFDWFADMVRSVVGVPVALVSLVGDDRQFFPGARGLGQPWQERRQTPLSHSFCQHVVATAEPLIVTDARSDARVRGNLAVDELGVIAYAGMPLTDEDGHVLGSLCAIDHQPRRWTAQELARLAELAAGCSRALRARIASDQAQVQQQAGMERERRAQAAVERSQLLLRASAALGAATTFDEVVDTVRTLVIGNLDPVYVGVSTLAPDGFVHLASGRQLPERFARQWKLYGADQKTPSGLAARTGRLVSFPDLAAIAEQTPDSLATFHALGWQSAASVPLPGEHGPAGALTIVWKQPHMLTDGEQVVLTALAGFVAQALHRAAAYEDQRTAATTMQQALLSTLPEVSHVRMAAQYVPAQQNDLVGGDWYDVIDIDEQRLALVIGDVAGHGITAAATMSQYRTMLRTLLVDHNDHASALLQRLERTTRALGLTATATAMVAYLTHDQAGGHTLTWSNAGHIPPTLVLPDGRISLLARGGPLLGGLRNITRRTHTRHLPPGCLLLLHTDGLIETRTRPIDDGIARLHQLLAVHGGAPLCELADILMNDTNPVDREDDASLLLIRTAPA
ncbi:phosphatase [Actinoplanes sp. SE50]|uniref:GAF domain-containing SpoIIE family protein phosphatase n=1 Tax=unclassified Actinoplanes TaxID=2626549 RepID=UPI00023EC957|nr:MULTISPECIES: SpoIIE family protein phosphatase [unclassified Actinoplanes]AEV84231.1 Phosphoserine phosphatase rsbU [Actinoplanes sp. SE50/110]ATO82623.1 phosphatase [Actinoplanes sp. SE50]SLM00030.1 phosphatase [Actinoplanes sp. SE50/110]